MYIWKPFCFIIHFIPHFDFILITRAEQIKLIWKVKLKHLYIAKICNSRNFSFFYRVFFLCHELARSRCNLLVSQEIVIFFNHCHFSRKSWTPSCWHLNCNCLFWVSFFVKNWRDLGARNRYLFHPLSILGRSWIPLCRHWTTPTLSRKSSTQ